MSRHKLEPHIVHAKCHICGKEFDYVRHRPTQIKISCSYECTKKALQIAQQRAKFEKVFNN